AERGVQVTYEPIRQWCQKFGPANAAGVRQRRPPARPRWHLDEVFIRIRQKTYYLWRAVDEEGIVLDILVQERRNQEAAEAFLHRVVEGQPGEPRVVITDKLASYTPAIKKVLPRAKQPYYFRLATGDLFAFAGLYSTPQGNELGGSTIITT